jgi:hypothetical protein
MIFKDLNFNYDSAQVIQEILSCREHFFEIPPYDYILEKALDGEFFMVESQEKYQAIDYIKNTDSGFKKIKRSIAAPHSFYIRHSDVKSKSYQQIKNSKTESFFWNSLVLDKLSYTRSIIEKLPFDRVDCVRAFIIEQSFLPTHHDNVNGCDENNIGISLVPVHSGTPMIVYDSAENKTIPILSPCFLFDDSNYHGIPWVNNIRIDIRVFGKLNYNQLHEIIK